MAVLNIRNLPDEVHAKLRVRAAKAGRSMEAEARDQKTWDGPVGMHLGRQLYTNLSDASGFEASMQELSDRMAGMVGTTVAEAKEEEGGGEEGGRGEEKKVEDEDEGRNRSEASAADRTQEEGETRVEAEAEEEESLAALLAGAVRGSVAALVAARRGACRHSASSYSVVSKIRSVGVVAARRRARRRSSRRSLLLDYRAYSKIRCVELFVQFFAERVAARHRRPVEGRHLRGLGARAR